MSATASRPSASSCQNARSDGAPGNRQAMPTSASASPGDDAELAGDAGAPRPGDAAAGAPRPGDAAPGAAAGGAVGAGSASTIAARAPRLARKAARRRTVG